MSDTRDRVARSIASTHVQLYQATGGLLGGLVGGMPVLLLTTTGRRSGRTHTAPLTYLRIDGRIILIASYGGANRHPAWYLNLDARPAVEVQRWRRSRPMTARTLSGTDREAVWSKVVRRAPIYGWYQRRTDREIPLVELVSDGDKGDIDDGPAESVDLDSMTKAELVEIARAIDLPGRSKMNKSELLRALRAREEEIGDAARGI